MEPRTRERAFEAVEAIRAIDIEGGWVGEAGKGDGCRGEGGGQRGKRLGFSLATGKHFVIQRTLGPSIHGVDQLGFSSFLLPFQISRGIEETQTAKKS